MRIVQVGAGLLPIPPVGYGAVERHVWNLTRALEARGHTVTIVNRAMRGRYGLREYLSAFRARRDVERLEYDVLHLHTPGVAAVFTALGPRRFVFTSHSRHWTLTHGLRERAGFWLERRAVRSSQQVIAVSSLVADRIAAMGSARQVHVVPHGVDAVRFRPDPARRRGLRVCCVGEIAPHKCQQIAAAAVRDSPWTLMLAGPVRDRAYAERVRRAGRDRVVLLGPVDEAGVIELLQSSAVLVHPSISESFGMAMLEGMAAGLPVVAGAIAAGLVRDGENGFLVPETLDDDARVAAFRACLETLAADPVRRAAMGERSRARAVSDFSWERVAERVEEIYRLFASENAGSFSMPLRRGREKPTSTPAP